MRTRLLSAPDLALLVRRVGIDTLMDDTIARLFRSCRDYDVERFDIPVRSGFFYTSPQTGLLEWMPAHEMGRGITVKLVGYHPANPSRERLPTILSALLRFDTVTGRVTGVVDGNFLTALRTGAASAVASRLLADPEARTLGLIGCGAQAVTQLHAISRVFDLARVQVFDVEPTVSASFRARVERLGIEQLTIETVAPEAVVAGADILCTQTSVAIGAGPVFADRNVPPRLHVNAVGSDFPGKTEVPRSLLERALVCPDVVAQAVHEGECQQLDGDVAGPDLPTLVRNAVDGRYPHDGVSVFDSTGWALEDHVTAEVLFAHADRLGIGADIELQSHGHDPLDPYGFVDNAAPVSAVDAARTARR